MIRKLELADFKKHPVKIKGARPPCYEGDESGPGCKGCIWSVLNYPKPRCNPHPCETRFARYAKKNVEIRLSA